MVPANLAEVNWTCDLTNYLRSDLLRNKEISVLTFMNLKRKRRTPECEDYLYFCSDDRIMCYVCF